MPRGLDDAKHAFEPATRHEHVISSTSPSTLCVASFSSQQAASSPLRKANERQRWVLHVEQLLVQRVDTLRGRRREQTRPFQERKRVAVARAPNNGIHLHTQTTKKRLGPSASEKKTHTHTHDWVRRSLEPLRVATVEKNTLTNTRHCPILVSTHAPLQERGELLCASKKLPLPQHCHTGTKPCGTNPKAEQRALPSPALEKATNRVSTHEKNESYSGRGTHVTPRRSRSMHRNRRRKSRTRGRADHPCLPSQSLRNMWCSPRETKWVCQAAYDNPPRSKHCMRPRDVRREGTGDVNLRKCIGCREWCAVNKRPKPNTKNEIDPASGGRTHRRSHSLTGDGVARASWGHRAPQTLTNQQPQHTSGHHHFHFPPRDKKKKKQALPHF